MRSQNIIRTVLFVVFFGIGAAALSGAIVCDDLLQHYQNRQLLRTAEENLERLTKLNADYDAVLGELEADPNVFKRLAPATLGTEPADANTVYPKATAEHLAAARRALAKDTSGQPAAPQKPGWLERCNEPRRRIVLFASGAFLILISFVCFGPAGPEEQARKISD